MKLFTKDINQKLFAQYRIGSNLNKQKVVAKIFNPYGEGRWYLLNSDPNDPDYLWAIVQMGDEVEIRSVSRRELESIRIKPFGLPLERDMYFNERIAMEVLDGLEKGKTFAVGGMLPGRYYRDNKGEELRFVGESQGKLLFKDGEKYVYKDESDFENDFSKEKKLFGFFEEGGETEEGVDLFEDYDEIPDNVQEILQKYDFEEGDYRTLEKAKKDVEKVGYTFEYSLDGTAYDLRKIGQKGKSEDEEYAKGGMVTLYDDYDKSAGYIIEKGNKYWTGKNWSDIKAYAESYKTKKEAEQKLKSTKMAKGGLVKISVSDIEDSDFQSLSQIFESNDAAFYIDESEENVMMDLKGISDGDDKEQALEIIGKYDVQRMANGGKIKDQYDGKTPQEIWESLSKEQRQHFLYDHKDDIEEYRGKEFGELSSKEIVKAYNSNYDELDKNIKNRFNNHTREGQYAKGGEINWGEDLGDGFSVGNDVYITDSKSMYKGKTGFVSGLAGKDLLVTFSENGNERNVVVSKKGVEKLDAPMADGGEVDEEDSLDYNSISDLQSERNRLVRWKYQYNSKGADYKIKKLEERIEYLKSKDSKMAKGGNTQRTVKLTLSDKDSYDYTYKQDGATASITFGFGKEPFQYEVKKISKSLEPLKQDILDAFTIQGIKQHEYKGGFSEAIKHLDTKVVYEDNMAKGGMITKNDIVSGARFKDSSGIVFIIDKVGEINKEDGYQLVETSMEGGSKGNYKDDINDLVLFLNEEKAKKMADGGQTIAGFPKDYHELNMNFLKIFNEYGFLNSEKYGNNTYVNESGDIIHWWPKTNHSEGQLRLTFNKTYNDFDREVLYDFQKKHIDYSVYYEYFFKNWVFYVYLSQGKESNYNIQALIKLFNEFNLPKGQRVGKLSFTPYYADGGEVADDGENESFEKKVKDAMKHPNKWYFIADYMGDKKVVLKMFVGVKEVDVQIFKIDGVHARMPRNYSGRRDTLKMIMDNFEPKMAKGGETENAKKVLKKYGFNNINEVKDSYKKGDLTVIEYTDIIHKYEMTNKGYNFDKSGYMAKGGTIKVGSKISYQGKEGKIVSKKGDMYFVEIENYYPNGDTSFTVLRDGEFKKMAEGGMTSRVKKIKIPLYYNGLNGKVKISEIESRIIKNAINRAKESNTDVKIYFSKKQKVFYFTTSKPESDDDLLAADVSISGEVTQYGGNVKVVKVGDKTFYLTYIDRTHYYVSLSPEILGKVYNIKPFYQEKHSWLNEEVIDWLSDINQHKGEFIDDGKMADGGKINIGTIKKTDTDVLFDKQSGTFYVNLIDGAGNRVNKVNVNTIDDVFEKYPTFKLNTIGQKEFPDSMAMGGEIKVGNKFGDWSITQYKPIVYEEIGGTRDGLVKLVNQNTFDEIFIQYDGALRSPKWFVRNKGVRIEGKNPKEVIEKLKIESFAMGGKVKFEDKVKAIKESLLKRKKVSPKVQKDYGKTYSPKEAEESAKRIAASQRLKYELKKKFKKGGKTIAQTPAPKKDRVFGSSKNKAGSASSKKTASNIELNESIVKTLAEKAKEYNEKHSSKVSTSTLKAVMRRGMGAFSTSHRPGMTRQGWGYARVNKFLLKKGGTKVKTGYVQDDDLLENGGELKKEMRVSDKPKFKKFIELEERAKASMNKTKNYSRWNETTGENFRRRWNKMASELRGWDGEFIPMGVKSNPDWIKFTEEQGSVEDYNFGDVLA